MTAQGQKIVLSRGPYMNRTRARQQCNTLNFRQRGRETITKENLDRTPVERQEEVDTKLKVVCDSLESKNMQCKFLIQQNEQLNKRLIELSKCNQQYQEPDSLSVSSKMAQSHTAVEHYQPAKDNRSMRNRGNQTNVYEENSKKKRLEEAELQLSRIEQIQILNLKVKELKEQAARDQAELVEKSRVAEKLNKSLLQAIESSSKLMEEKGELCRKLEQATISLRQIENLYNNTKKFIMKDMDASQSDVNNHSNLEGDSECQFGELSRQECSKLRELEILRYQLALKQKECEDREGLILQLRNMDDELSKLRITVLQQQKQIIQLKKDAVACEPISNSRLSSACRTISNEMQHIFTQLQLCERLIVAVPAEQSAILRSVQEMVQKSTVDIEHVCSGIITKKLEVDRFMRQLHSKLTSISSPVKL